MSIDVTIKYAVATNKSSLDVVRQLINGEGDFTPSTSLVEFQNEAKQRPVYIESIVAILHNVTWPLHQFHHFRAAGDMLLTHDSATYVTVSCSDEVVEKQAEDMLRRVLLPSTEKLDNSGRTPKIEKTETEKLEEERIRRWQRETDALELTLQELQAVLIYMTGKRVEIIRWAHFFLSKIENDFGKDCLVKEPKHLLSEQELEKMAMELRWFSFPELLDTTRHDWIDVKEMRTLTNDRDLSESFVDLLPVIEKKQANEIQLMIDSYTESDIYKQSVTLLIYDRQFARHRIYGHYCRLLLLCMNRIWGRLHVKIAIPIHEQVKRLQLDVQTYKDTHDIRQIEGHLKSMDGLLTSIFNKFESVMDALWKLIGSIDNLRVFGESDIYDRAAEDHKDAIKQVKNYTRSVAASRASFNIAPLLKTIHESETVIENDDLMLQDVQSKVKDIDRKFGKNLGPVQEEELKASLKDINKEIQEIRESISHETEKIAQATDTIDELEKTFVKFVVGVKQLFGIAKEQSLEQVMAVLQDFLAKSAERPLEPRMISAERQSNFPDLEAKERTLTDKMLELHATKKRWQSLYRKDVEQLEKTVKKALDLMRITSTPSIKDALNAIRDRINKSKSSATEDKLLPKLEELMVTSNEILEKITQTSKKEEEDPEGTKVTFETIDLINKKLEELAKEQFVVAREIEEAEQALREKKEKEEKKEDEEQKLQKELENLEKKIEILEQISTSSRVKAKGREDITDLRAQRLAIIEKLKNLPKSKEEQEKKVSSTDAIDDPFEQVWNQQ